MPQEAEAVNSVLRPIMVGDLIGEQCVAGFTWIPPEDSDETWAPSSSEDRLVFQGEEGLVRPVARRVPLTSENVTAPAPVPPDDLPPERVHQAVDVGDSTAERVQLLLDSPGAQWQPLIRTLTASIHATGHRSWLAGGAVRDLLAGFPLHSVNDLDLTGTAPPGRFSELARVALRSNRMSEHRTTISPHSLVCAAIPPHTAGKTDAKDDRLIEYRGLKRTGFAFPVVGSSIAEDARTRDFSFNALLYDVMDHQVLDGSGEGVEDLRLRHRPPFQPLFRPLASDLTPIDAAMIIVRAAKFAHRWNVPAPDQQMADWIGRLDLRLPELLTADCWRRLDAYYATSVHAPVPAQRAHAIRLPEPGRSMLVRLIGDQR